MGSKKKKRLAKNSRPRRWVWAIAVGLFSFLLYANSISNGYNMDDSLVTKGHRLSSRGVEAIPEIFRSSYAKILDYEYDYRPVVVASFAIEHEFFGEDPHTGHFINVLLFALLCMLLFYTLGGLFDKHHLLLPLCMVLLFAAHPIHTEVVASLKNRDELLSLLFAVLALWLSLRIQKVKQWWLLPLVALLFAGGLLAKQSTSPMAVLTPLAFIFLKKVRLKEVLFISLAWSLPAAWTLPIPSTTNKVLFFVGLNLFVFVVFRLYHHPISVWERMGRAWRLTTTGLESVVKRLGAGFRRSFEKLFDMLRDADSRLSPKGLALPSGFSFFPARSEGSGLQAVAAVILLLPLALAFLTGLTVYLGVTAAISLALYYWISARSRMLPVIVLCVLLGWISVQFNSFLFLNVGLLILISHFVLVPGSSRTLLLAAILGLFLTGLFQGGAVVGPLTYGGVMALFLFLFLKRKHVLSFGLSIFVFLLSALQFLDGDIPSAVFLLITAIFISLLNSRKLRPWSLSFLVVSLGLFLVIVVDQLGKENKGWNNQFLAAFGVEYQYQDTGSGLALDETELREVVEKGSKKVQLELLSSTRGDDARKSYTVGRPTDFVEYPLILAKPGEKLGTSLYVLGYYTRLLIVPYPLRFYYGYKVIPIVSILEPTAMLSLVLHLMLAVAALFFWKRRSVFAFGSLFYLAAIFPYSNLVVPVSGMMGERLAFTASLGWCIFGVAALLWLFGAKTRGKKVSMFKGKEVFWLAFGALTVTYSVLTVLRNPVWKDHLTLYRHDMAYNENSAQGHSILAGAVYSHGLNSPDPQARKEFFEEAAKHYQEAVEVYPYFYSGHYYLGRTYVQLRDWDRASRVFDYLIELDTTFYGPHLQKAFIFGEKGAWGKAIPIYEEAIRRGEQLMPVYTSLGNAYYQTGQTEKAIRINKDALEFFPDDYSPNYNIGMLLWSQGKAEEALPYLEKAYAMGPNEELGRYIEQVKQGLEELRMEGNKKVEN